MEFRVTRNGQTVSSLAPREYLLLESSCRTLAGSLEPQPLIDQFWGTDYVVDTKTVDVHIPLVTGKLEANPSAPLHISTVRGLPATASGDASLP